MSLNKPLQEEVLVAAAGEGGGVHSTAKNKTLAMAVLIETGNGKHPGRFHSPASMQNSSISATTIEL